MRRNQRGFTFIELSWGLVVMVGAVLLIAGLVALLWQQWTYIQVARQTRQVSYQYGRYYLANHDSMLASGTFPITVTQAQASAAGYPIPTTANAYGQQYEMWIIKDATGELRPVVFSVGGQVITSRGVRAIAAAITSANGAGGFVDVAQSSLEPGVANVYGTNGLNLPLAVFGKTPGAGHVADAIYMTVAVQQPGLTNTALQRMAIPGQPDYNTMHTDIQGGGNSIRNFNTINAQYVGSAGKDGASGYPGGWGGGFHGYDAYLEGSLGLGAGGTLNGGIWNNGNIFGTQLNITGEVYVNNWMRSMGDSGWYNQKWGCGIWQADGTWVRVYGSCGFLVGGQLQAGSVVSNGRLTANEYIQLNGSVNLGWSCSPNGLLGQASDGSGAAQCKGGVWTTMMGMVDEIQVVSGNNSCGNDGSMAQAQCPAGYRVTGGGYQMTALRPGGGATNSGNAPQNNQPNGNGWFVYAGGGTGASCFAAYAMCGR